MSWTIWVIVLVALYTCYENVRYFIKYKDGIKRGLRLTIALTALYIAIIYSFVGFGIHHIQAGGSLWLRLPYILLLSALAAEARADRP